MPSMRDSLGIKRNLPMAKSSTSSVTVATTSPGKADLMPVTSAPATIVPAVT